MVSSSLKDHNRNMQTNLYIYKLRNINTEYTTSLTHNNNDVTYHSYIIIASVLESKLHHLYIIIMSVLSLLHQYYIIIISVTRSLLYQLYIITLYQNYMP